MREANRVVRKFPVAGSSHRVVLFSWAADPERRKENVARLDSHGNVVWRAQLPGQAANDCFNGLLAEGDFFVARTFSEWTVRLDADGNVHKASRQPITT